MPAAGACGFSVRCGHPRGHMGAVVVAAQAFARHKLFAINISFSSTALAQKQPCQRAFTAIAFGHIYNFRHVLSCVGENITIPFCGINTYFEKLGAGFEPLLFKALIGGHEKVVTEQNGGLFAGSGA